MSQYKYAEIADTVYFWFAANTTAGTAGDGATPLYDVRLAGAAAAAAATASGTPTLLTSADYTDGLHEIAIDTTGYAAGEYAVFCTLTISTVNPAGFCGSFLLRTAGTPALAVDLVSILGTVLTETAGLLAGGFKKFFNIATPTGTLDSLPDAVPGAAGGVAIAGANAATTFATLSVTGQLDAGSILVVAGMDIVGGFSMNSLLVETTTTLTGAVALSSTLAIAGAATLASLSVTGQFDAGNLLIDGTTAFTGAVTTGAVTAASATITGATIHTGNVSYADGITVAAPSTLNRGGVDVTGNGTGSGLSVAGGATGHGVSAVSGGVGDGIYAHSATTGHGLHCVGGGVAGDGIHADGDTNGDGITAVGVGAGQYDINADIHGTIDTVTTNSDLVTAAAIKTAMEADAGDLSSLMEALVNKRIWTEIGGNLEMFDDAGVSRGNIASQVSTDGVFTTAKRAFI